MAKKTAAPERPHSRHLPVPSKLLEHHADTALSAMQQWKEQDRVPPVLLISGPSGVGKRALVHHISQWLLCEKSGFQKAAAEAESEEISLFGELPAKSPAPSPSSDVDAGIPAACGDCPACHRALSGNWINFTEIKNEKDDESSALKIDQFRELKASVGFGAFDGAFKIILIPEAERMTVQAANSLLKLLEEPPHRWVFFLTAADPSLLLPTIVSRCQTLRVKPLGKATLTALLNDSEVPKDRLAICAELAQGSFSKALYLAQDEIWDQRDTLFRFLQKPSAELNHLVDWATQDPSHFDLLLDQFEQVTADLIRWSLAPQISNTALMNSDGRRSLESHFATALKKFGSAENAREFWLARAERIYQIRKEALAPLNRKLLLQDILVPWLEIG